MLNQLLGLLMVLDVLMWLGWIGMGFKSKVDHIIHSRLGWTAGVFTGITIYAGLMINLGTS